MDAEEYMTDIVRLEVGDAEVVRTSEGGIDGLRLKCSERMLFPGIVDRVLVLSEVVKRGEGQYYTHQRHLSDMQSYCSPIAFQDQA